MPRAEGELECRTNPNSWTHSPEPNATLRSVHGVVALAFAAEDRRPVFPIAVGRDLGRAGARLRIASLRIGRARRGGRTLGGRVEHLDLANRPPVLERLEPHQL